MNTKKKKQIIVNVLRFIVCLAVIYFIDNKIFIYLDADVRGPGGLYVIVDPMKYLFGGLLLYIIWELKKLNAKFGSDEEE